MKETVIPLPEQANRPSQETLLEKPASEIAQKELAMLRGMAKIFMSGSNAIIIEDIAGHVIEMNSEAARVYGWSRTELIGQPLKTVVPPEYQEQYKDIQALLLQMIRELLFNTVKHAGVDQAQVSVQQHDGLLRIEVEDQGRGFDLREARDTQTRQGSFGLLTMQERLAFIGGRLEIDSASGQGSRITIVIPVEPDHR